MKTGNLSNLLFNVRNSTSHFESCILELSHCPWRNLNAETFEDKYNEIRNCIKESENSDLLQLFDLYLITASLLDPKKPPWVHHFICKNLKIDQYLGINFQQLEKSTWQEVPILLAGGNGAHIKKFIVGRLSREAAPDPAPPWAISLFDESFLESARTALEFIIDHASHRADMPTAGHFIFYPLTHANNKVQFKGRSGSLALALGFKRLLEEMPPISDKVICTGVIQTDGNIKKVGGIETKSEIFQNTHPFRCLLCPVSNSINEFTNNPDEKKITLPVKTFDQAWMVAHLYTETHQNKLFLLTKISDPKFFTDNLKSLPGEWIAWISQEKKAEDILQNIIEDPDLLNEFTKKFQSVVENYHLDQAAAISSLMTESMLDHIHLQAPRPALRWYTFNLSLANHQGDVVQSTAWEKRSMTLVDRVKKLDNKLEATCFNHCLVAYHNRFEFTPDLPRPLKKILEALKSEYRIQSNNGCILHSELGKLYGTLMQHYAFCGPQYIRKTEEYSQKALAALGENLGGENRGDWLRQYSYLTYARLDAKDFTGAAESLEKYLEMDESNAFFLKHRVETIHGISPVDKLKSKRKAISFIETLSIETLSCWELALVCRFFAQVKDHPHRQAIYEHMCLFINDQIKTDHPWQLCTFNLGQIALDIGDEKNACRLLEKSRKICLSSKSGPTIRVMALLPLSLLANLPEQIDIKSFYKIMDQSKNKILAAARQLDGSHFAFLQEMSFEKALVKVRENPGKVFPFSYR